MTGGLPDLKTRQSARGRADAPVGARPYADDPAGVTDACDRRVLGHVDLVGDRLVIGRFCAIAGGACFVMSGGSHAKARFSAHPFELFGVPPGETPPKPAPRDTVVAHDIWIGRDASIPPGVAIGRGATVGAGAVAASDVPPCAAAVGTPRHVVREGVDPAPAIRGHDLAALERLAP